MLYNFHVDAVGWTYDIKCSNISGLIKALRSMSDTVSCNWFDKKWVGNTTYLSVDYMDGRGERVKVTRCSLL